MEIQKQHGHKASSVLPINKHTTTYEGIATHKPGHSHNSDSVPISRVPIHGLGANGQAIGGMDILAEQYFGPLHYGSDLGSNSSYIEVYPQ